MKFLRVLVNSILSGVFFASLLALLFFNLNINLKPTLSFFAGLGLFLSASYGLIITLTCLVVFFLFHFLSGREIKISFISPTFLSLSFSLLIFLFFLILVENVRYFRSFFDSARNARIEYQKTVLLVLAFLGLVFFHVIRRYKKSRFYYLLYFLLLVLGMASIVSQRLKFPYPTESERTSTLEPKKIDKKILIIGLEGLSFDFIIPLISQGKLPNFSWLVESGSWGRLESFSPNEPPILNSSFDTGKFPSQHRQVSPFLYSLPTTGQTFEVVPRFLLFRQWLRFGLLKISPRPPEFRPTDIWQVFQENGTSYLKSTWPAERSEGRPDAKAESAFGRFFKEFEADNTRSVGILKSAFFADWTCEEMASEERSRTQPQIFYLLLNGLNAVEAFFYKYAYPELFGNLDQYEISRYGSVIEKYYELYDQILGKYLASLKEVDLLVVYSSHGIEPLPLWRRFVEWVLGNIDLSAYHENAPDGTIFFYGNSVARGKSIEGIRLVDLAPTLLYYVGLPVGKDMDGIVRSSPFLRNFTAENPIFYISSYEDVQIQKP